MLADFIQDKSRFSKMLDLYIASADKFSSSEIKDLNEIFSMGMEMYEVAKQLPLTLKEFYVFLNDYCKKKSFKDNKTCVSVDFYDDEYGIPYEFEINGIQYKFRISSNNPSRRQSKSDRTVHIDQPAELKQDIVQGFSGERAMHQAVKLFWKFAAKPNTSPKESTQLPEPIESTSTEAERKKVQKYDDYGEKIGGAKKDLYQRLKNMSAATDDDIISWPLSKIFPPPDYVQLYADKLLTLDGVMILKFVYEHIPRKPRANRTYDTKKWVSQVKSVIRVFNDLIDKQLDASEYIRAFTTKRTEAGNEYQTSIGQDYRKKSKLWQEMGFPLVNVDLGEYDIVEWDVNIALNPETDTLEHYTKHWNKVTISFDKTFIPETETKYFSIVFKNQILKSFHTREEAVKALFMQIHGSSETNENKKISFSIYQSNKGNKQIFIGKKMANDVVDVSVGIELKTVAEARTYLKEKYDEILARFIAMKTEIVERRITNRPRIGKDWRNGKDITPEQFSKEFGFRGIEFGNWVPGRERQIHINNAYDALMDLSLVTKLPPKAIALNGELALAFGARGSKGAAAHYERDKIVINLTRMQGSGSLAHEWFHAFDNYFMRKNGRKDQFFTDHPHVYYTSSGKSTLVTDGTIEAFRKLALGVSSHKAPIYLRSRVLDTMRAKPYWGTTIEICARLFESYVVECLEMLGGLNDYLANFKTLEEWGENFPVPENSYPYALEREMDTVLDMYTGIFTAIKTEKSGEKDVYNLSDEYAQLSGFLDDQGKFIAMIDLYIASADKFTPSEIADLNEIFNMGMDLYGITKKLPIVPVEVELPEAVEEKVAEYTAPDYEADADAPANVVYTDDQTITENFMKVNSDGKLELHFSYDKFKSLAESQKKYIKSYFLWSRGKKAWVSKSKHPFDIKTKAEYLSKELDLVMQGKDKRRTFSEELEKKQSSAEYRAERYEAKAAAAEKRGEQLQREFNKKRSDWSWLTQPIDNSHSGSRAFGRQREKVVASYSRGFQEFDKAKYYEDKQKLAEDTLNNADLKSISFVENRIKDATKAIKVYTSYIEQAQKKLTPEWQEIATARGLKPEDEEVILDRIAEYMEKLTYNYDKLAYYRLAEEAIKEKNTDKGIPTFGKDTQKRIAAEVRKYCKKLSPDIRVIANGSYIAAAIRSTTDYVFPNEMRLSIVTLIYGEDALTEKQRENVHYGNIMPRIITLKPAAWYKWMKMEGIVFDNTLEGLSGYDDGESLCGYDDDKAKFLALLGKYADNLELFNDEEVRDLHELFNMGADIYGIPKLKDAESVIESRSNEKAAIKQEQQSVQSKIAQLTNPNMPVNAWGNSMDFDGYYVSKIFAFDTGFTVRSPMKKPYTVVKKGKYTFLVEKYKSESKSFPFCYKATESMSGALIFACKESMEEALNYLDKIIDGTATEVTRSGMTFDELIAKEITKATTRNQKRAENFPFSYEAHREYFLLKAKEQTESNSQKREKDHKLAVRRVDEKEISRVRARLEPTIRDHYKDKYLAPSGKAQYFPPSAWGTNQDFDGLFTSDKDFSDPDTNKRFWMRVPIDKKILAFFQAAGHEFFLTKVKGSPKDFQAFEVFSGISIGTNSESVTQAEAIEKYIKLVENARPRDGKDISPAIHLDNLIDEMLRKFVNDNIGKAIPKEVTDKADRQKIQNTINEIETKLRAEYAKPRKTSSMIESEEIQALERERVWQYRLIGMKPVGDLSLSRYIGLSDQFEPTTTETMDNQSELFSSESLGDQLDLSEVQSGISDNMKTVGSVQDFPAIPQQVATEIAGAIERAPQLQFARTIKNAGVANIAIRALKANNIITPENQSAWITDSTTFTDNGITMIKEGLWKNLFPHSLTSDFPDYVVDRILKNYRSFLQLKKNGSLFLQFEIAVELGKDWKADGRTFEEYCAATVFDNPLDGEEFAFLCPFLYELKSDKFAWLLKKYVEWNGATDRAAFLRSLGADIGEKTTRQAKYGLSDQYVWK